MIFRQFNAVFAQLGVEAIPTEGRLFDPAWHEAIMRVEDSGEIEGTILAEIQKGYKINERIIRASKVQVAG
jgi:molecular chaperone GrpE